MPKLKNNSQIKTKPKIMFCTGFWLTGGVERKMSNLFKGLVNYYDIYLFAIVNQKSMIKVPNQVKILKLTKEEFYKSYADTALKYIKKYKIDVVVGVMNLFYGQLDLYEKCYQAGVKTIAANSEYFFYPYFDKDFYNIVNWRQEVYKKVDAVLWQTDFGATAHNLINNNGYVMPNPNTFSKQAKLAEKKDKIILSVGRFNDYIKRIDRILSCFSLVLKQEPEAKLYLVGPCDKKLKIEKLGNKSINKMLYDLKIDESKIIFVGETDAVKKYYRQASLLLLTSENEGFPNVINEATCFGLPVVCNNIPGIEDIVVDGYNGFISEQDDIRSLSKNILKLLVDFKLRSKMGEQASIFAENFDIKKILKKWRLLLEIIIFDQDKSKLQDELRPKINQKLDNYTAFTGIFFNELHKATSIALEKITNEQQLTQENKKIKNQLSLVEQEMFFIKNSKSWKVIELFRSIKSKFKKIIFSSNNKRNG